MNVFLYRPLAAPIVWALRDTRITPNQITLASFGVALISVVLLLAWPGWLGLCVAVGVYSLAYILDCADGMLARWRGIQSTPGHLFDFLMDEIKSFAVLGAASVRLYLDARSQGQGFPELSLLVGILGLVCLSTGIALTGFQRRPEITGQGQFIPRETDAATLPPPGLTKRVIGGIESVAKVLIHYPSYLPLVALLNHLDYYFYPYVLINALYAARMVLWLSLRFGRS